MAEIKQFSSYGALVDIPCWELTLGDSQVVVSSYGAHVLAYNVKEKPILWLSETALWQNGKAIRGGIPICWPWFGACPQQLNIDNSPKPNHGLARTQLWSIAEHSISEDSVTLCLKLTDLILPWVEGTVNLHYTVELTAQSLTVTLRSDKPLTQQAALHSYFNVENCQSAKVSPLPLQFYDKTIDSMTSSNNDYCDFKAEIDRVYTDTADALCLKMANLDIEIRQSGHDSSIVWNPGALKSAQAPDIAPNTWHQFVCVESAALNLEPSVLCLSQQIRNPFA
jgi:glucose-6-phosphate 1-epimerase